MLDSTRRKSRDDRIVKMYVKDRMTGPRIAERFDLWPTRVGQILRARGIKARPNGWNLLGKPLAKNNARNRTIMALYQRHGLSATEISQRLRQQGTTFTPSGVLYILKSRGIKRKPNGWYPKPTPEFSLQVRAYARAIAPLVGRGPGLSAADLAIEGGFKPATLRLHLRALGVKMRSGLGDGKLSFEDVRQIKAWLVHTQRTHADLADHYGVGHTTIWSIARGHTWTDVPWPRGKVYKPRRRVKPHARRRARSDRLRPRARRR